MKVSAVFAVTATVIGIGFGGRALFRKTRIPDIPILLGAGVLLGPVFHLVEPPILLPLAPYVGTLALLVIMLEGGMSLDIDRVLHQMKWAFLLTVAAFLSSVAGVAAAYRWIAGAPLLHSLLIGAILGCTSGAVVIPLVREMRMAQNTRTILTLEAALGDALAVVTVVFLVRYIQTPSLSIGEQGAGVLNAFWWGGVLGAAGGIFWVRILAALGRMPLAYMLTMAAILLLYALAEMIHSSGIFAVLVFGIAISNAATLVKRIPALRGKADWKASQFALHRTIRWFHEEVTFLARVFFFVYLGMLLSIGRFNLVFTLASAAMVAAIYLTRNLSVRIVGWFGRTQVPFERKILTAMAPRGLASAVLATLPVAAGIPETDSFIQYTFVVITATNLLLTTAVVRSEMRLERIISRFENDGSAPETGPGKSGDPEGTSNEPLET
ncbi:MAG: hypothetical protein Kow00128_01830 [Deltaproteobacteria bacterium]